MVKGIHLEGLRGLGQHESFAKYYYENGAGELIYQDQVASLYERNSLHEIMFPMLHHTDRWWPLPLTR